MGSGEDPITYEYGYEDRTIHGIILLKCIEGCYQDHNFIFSTQEASESLKTEHLLGCGGGGEAPDLFLPKGTGASQRHCLFTFDQNAWWINDERSSNGTFLLIRNHEQFMANSISNAVPLFQRIPNHPRGEYFDSAVILVAKYTFMLQKI